MKSQRGPIVVFPTFLRGRGAELDFARRTYYLTQMRDYLSKYEQRLVKARARHILRTNARASL